MKDKFLKRCIADQMSRKKSLKESKELCQIMWDLKQKETRIASSSSSKKPC